MDNWISNTDCRIFIFNSFLLVCLYSFASFESMYFVRQFLVRLWICFSRSLFRHKCRAGRQWFGFGCDYRIAKTKRSRNSRFEWKCPYFLRLIVRPKSAMEFGGSDRDESGAIPIGFVVFAGIVTTIVICAIIFFIFTICYTLIRGNRNRWFQQPFNGDSDRPVVMHSSECYFSYSFVCSQLRVISRF